MKGVRIFIGNFGWLSRYDSVEMRSVDRQVDYLVQALLPTSASGMHASKRPGTGS